MRQLKRTLTLVEHEYEGGGDSGSSASDSTASPPTAAVAQQWPRPVPQLPVPNGSKDCGLMDPPLLPPPWKRASVVGVAEADARVPRPVASPQATPRRGPSSPQRLLTPRVSWSDIVSHSQDDEDHSPSTPLTRTHRRPPSPPRRPLCRRRRPSSEFRGAGAAERLGCQSHDQNEGRFEREFCGVTVIGKGQFSTVYRAQNRIDQCLYAVKKTAQISSHGLHQVELREVFALANVSMEGEGCQHIVRYYSSWLEDGRLHIQTELCECSLRDRLAQKRIKEPENPSFSEAELAEVLRHVGSGLRVLHGCGFVHLDVKPDNILVSRNARDKGCYKIADLGLAAAAIGSGCDDICEGDCRYLAKEVLRGDLSDLPRADVFSLGLVCYELATNVGDLPCNGEAWHRLRDGRPGAWGPLAAPGGPLAEGSPLLDLLARMLAAAPGERPRCEEVLGHPSVAAAPDEGARAVRDLREQMRQRTAEAERSRRLADEYWHEMVSMRRRELLGGATAGAGLSEAAVGTGMPCGTSATGIAPGGPSGGSSARGLGYAPVLRRGKTS